MAHIYQRGKNKIWWVQYYVNGKIKRESLKTTNKGQALREKTAIEANLLSPHRRAPEDKDPAVDDFWQRYSEWAAAHKRPRSIERTDLSWRHLTVFAEPKKLGDVTRDTIEKYKAWRKKADVTDQTVNNELRDLQAIFSRAIREEWYTGANPALGVERFTIPRTMPTFHSDEELNKLLNAARARGRVTEWVVLLGAWAGLRRSEIINARWEWFTFDPKKPTIHVSRSEGFEVKDHEDRMIPMSRRIYDALEPHMKPEGFLFEPAPWSKGKHHYRFDPKRGLLDALKAAGLTTKAPFQRLRHTFGSLHAQKGKSLYSIAKWMGHSSVTVTERHYAGLQSYDPDIDSF